MSDLELSEVTGLTWTDGDGITYKRVWVEGEGPVDKPVDIE